MVRGTTPWLYYPAHREKQVNQAGTMSKAYAAVDLGNSSGRVMLGRVNDDRVELSEVRRIPNAPYHRADGWHWDVRGLFDEAMAGLREAAGQVELSGIAIDTWGVDYGLLDADGNLLDDPFSYRDERTLPMVALGEARIAADDLYAQTGCQAGPINTLYQLLADQHADRLDQAERFLLNPDLFAWWLTGEVGADETIASTTQLFDPVARDWCWRAIDAMQLPRRIFAPVRRTGTVLSEARPDLGLPAGIPVITAAGHDTAAAFVAATGGSDQLVISIGTWSLVGVELTEPLITEAGREANFTNELGVLGTIRFLRNAAGMWCVQECLREWQERGEMIDWADLIDLADSSPAFTSLFDPDDRRFMEPGPMADRVMRAGDEPLDGSHGPIIRSILESLSMNHRWLLETVEGVLGRRLNRIRIVGGGSRNRLLCQMIADATGRPVIAGPAEATAIGNIAMQAIATGQIADLASARVLIDRSFPAETYGPNPDHALWDDEYARWRALANR
jgi:rhamnulokinase